MRGIGRLKGIGIGESLALSFVHVQSIAVNRKIIILFVNQNFESFLDMKNIIVKMENRAFDFRMEYSRKEFGLKYVDYLGPKNYNFMPITIKDIFVMLNRITTGIKIKNSHMDFFSA